MRFDTAQEEEEEEKEIKHFNSNGGLCPGDDLPALFQR